MKRWNLKEMIGIAGPVHDDQRSGARASPTAVLHRRELRLLCILRERSRGCRAGVF